MLKNNKNVLGAPACAHCGFFLVPRVVLLHAVLPPVVQGRARPGGDGKEAGGGSLAVHSEGWDTDCGPGAGQAGLGAGLQHGERGPG